MSCRAFPVLSSGGSSRRVVSLVLLSCALWSMGGCRGFDGEGTPLPGHPPEVTILAPALGAILYPGTATWQFEAIVFDVEDTNPALLKTQMVLLRDGAEVTRADIPPQADGRVIWRFSQALPQEDYLLRVSAEDLEGERSTAEQAFSVRNQLPLVTLVSPPNGSSVDQSVPLTIQVLVQDVDNPPGVPLQVTLLSAGVTVGETLVESGGTAAFDFSPAAAGSLILEIRASDELLGAGRALLTLSVNPCLDSDGDGIWSCARDGNPPDCDDADAAVSPGASERCNGRDDDCDSSIPEDEADADGDGKRVCEGDCNDLSPNIYSGASERCDGIDNDCDGAVPGNEYDADGDGFRGCAGDEGPADCDDTRSGIFPGAAEQCDGLDGDCDGVIPEGESDEDLDGHRPCGGDCDDTNFYTFPGASERLDFQDNDCDGVPEGTLTLTAAQGRFTGIQADAQLGFSVSSGGDLNGDGIDDLAIGSPRYNSQGTTATNRGGAFVVLGRSTGWRSQEGVAISRGIVLAESESTARAGTAVSIVSDMNGDKLDDLMVGVPGHVVGNFTEAGGAWLVPGRAQWVNDDLVDVSLTQVEGSSTGMLLGSSLSAGTDLNGDGVTDLAIGAPWSSRRPTAPGLIAVLTARTFGWSSKTAVNTLFRINGSENSAIGVSLAVGRTTPDAAIDLIVGGMQDPASTPGVVYWIPGSSAIRAAGQTSVSGLEAHYYIGDTSAERVGSSVSSGGDIDGDGTHDVLVGRGQNGGANDAAAYVLFGATAAPISGNLETVAQVKFARSSIDECPCTVLALPDFDGDGLGDLAIGVSRADAESRDVGRIYLFRGRRGRSAWPTSIALSTADGILVGENEREQAGYALSTGDVNGDGTSDLIIGAPFAPAKDASGVTLNNAGRVYVVLGPPPSE